MDGLIDMYDETTHGAEMLRQSTAEYSASNRYWTMRMDAAQVASIMTRVLQDIPDDALVIVCETLQDYLETGEWPGRID